MQVDTREFGRSLIVQFRVVMALVLREMRVRFGRTQLGYLWAFAEPLTYIIALSLIFSFMERHPPFGNSMALFFATGIIPFHLFRNVANQLTGAFTANEALLTYPIVQPIDTILGRFILEVATSIVIAIVVLGVVLIWSERPWPRDLIRMAEGFSLLALIGFGVGLTNAVVINHVSSWQNIFRMIMAPMLFVSAIFYSLDSLPPLVRDIVVWNPVVHGIEIVRDGFYTNYRTTGLNEFYLLSLGLGSTLVGLASERALRGKQL